MTREQMIAWLTLEGWQFVICNLEQPAFLKEGELLWYDDVNEPNGYVPISASRWAPEKKNIPPRDCPEDQYHDAWVKNVYTYVSRKVP